MFFATSTTLVTDEARYAYLEIAEFLVEKTRRVLYGGRNSGDFPPPHQVVRRLFPRSMIPMRMIPHLLLRLRVSLEFE